MTNMVALPVFVLIERAQFRLHATLGIRGAKYPPRRSHLRKTASTSLHPKQLVTTLATSAVHPGHQYRFPTASFTLYTPT